MPPQNRDFHSPDPLGVALDPLDQSSAKPSEELPPLSAQELRAIRMRMRLTQRQFAGWFGFPVATLRHWERGNRRPAGSALVLLNVIRENPRVVFQAVRKARMRDPGSLAPIEPLKSPRAPPRPRDEFPPRRRWISRWD